MTNDERLAWERQGGEGSKAFSAFCVYRDQGPQRSLDAAWRSTHPQQGHKRRSKTYAEWSRRWSWVARSELFDAHQDQLGRQTLAKELTALKEREARQIHSSLQVLTGFNRIALEVLSMPGQMAKLVADASSSPRKLLELMDRCGRHAHGMATLIAAERLVAGLSTATVEVEDRRAASLGARIPESAAATALAIALLNEVAGTGPGTDPPRRGGL